MFVVNNEKFKTLDDAQEYCFQQEIIYYHNAMEYLMKHDPSLRESLGYASDVGYEMTNISSEDLATLLYQQKLLEEIEEVTENSEDP